MNAVDLAQLLSFISVFFALISCHLIGSMYIMECVEQPSVMSTSVGCTETHTLIKHTLGVCCCFYSVMHGK